MATAIFPPELIDQIDALLPQTQCTRCGYPACRPYAQAIADGAAINQCPPGGSAGIAQLAQLLERDAVPLNPLHGVEQALRVAVIREDECIGCTLCIQACPVDAIIGAAKHMHTVFTELCTGCELCVAPCPVDCIEMIPANFAWSKPHAEAAKQRYLKREQRLADEAAQKTLRLASKPNRYINPDT